MKPWKHNKPIIGLSGAPGSGKSLVASQLAEAGLAVIDADALARQALDQPAVRELLSRWWGGSVLDAQGKIDRKAVGDIVFERPGELQKLEEVIHPRVLAMRRQLHEKYLADEIVCGIVEDCPLLYEAGLAEGCDVVIFVACERNVRLARVKTHRGWDEAELARREKNQWPLDMKASRADYVVDNSAGKRETQSQVQGVISEIFRV